ncbi:hypothetical protein FQZ97_407760 [compost metagenome]
MRKSVHAFAAIRRGLLASSLLQALALSAWCLVQVPLAQAGDAAVGQIDPTLTPTEIRQLSKQAFFWGMQQAGFYELRYLFTQQDKATTYRGLNRLQHGRRLFTAKQRFATTPNASTLYSGGFFDLREGPVVVLSPQVTDGRYWSIQGMDQYARWFFMSGSPFSGNAPQRYLIVGPDWEGSFPAGFSATEIVRAPSNAIVMTLRLAVKDKHSAADLAAAGKIMDGVAILPLTLWLQHDRQAPPVEKQPIVKASYASFPRMEQIGDLTRSMTPMDYLQLVSLVLNDASMTLRRDSQKELETLRDLARIGLRPGVIFDPARLGDSQRNALEAGFAEARQQARQAFQHALRDMNGWKLQTSLGYDDNDYVLRAGAAEIAWGSPVPYQSHTIAYGLQDADGQPLDGRHRYTLTFDLGQLPPVTEFWELPVYDDYGYFVDNPIDRYSATSYMQRNGDFVVHDGRITFYLQSTRPDDPQQARNWLPTPSSGQFRLAPRFYGPTSALIDGSYPMPKIARVPD